MLNKVDTPPPVVRREFDAEFDAERARRLRVRLMWYCGFIYALMALSIAHRGYVLQTGNIVLTDTGQNLKANDMVRKAYLGI